MEAPPYDFVVDLEKKADCQNIGLNVFFPRGVVLTVESIAEKGMVPSWNLAHSVVEQLCIGDHLVGVNDIFGVPSAMLKAIQDNTTLKLYVSKGVRHDKLVEAETVEEAETGATEQQFIVRDETPIAN